MLLIKLCFRQDNVYLPDVGFVDTGGSEYVLMKQDEYRTLISKERRIIMKPVSYSKFSLSIPINIVEIDDPSLAKYMKGKCNTHSTECIMDMIKKSELTSSLVFKPNSIILCK